VGGLLFEASSGKVSKLGMWCSTESQLFKGQKQEDHGFRPARQKHETLSKNQTRAKMTGDMGKVVKCLQAQGPEFIANTTKKRKNNKKEKRKKRQDAFSGDG
jgi:hypothetical protein